MVVFDIVIVGSGLGESYRPPRGEGLKVATKSDCEQDLFGIRGASRSWGEPEPADGEQEGPDSVHTKLMRS